MNVLIVCLLLAMVLPYLAKAPVAWAMAKDGGYDNAHPRAQQARLTGFGARAVAAHQNAFESLLLFAPAVLLVIATGSINQVAEIAAVVHILARVSYQVFYLTNWDKLRSTSWFVAIIATFWLFTQAI
ncbi:MAPEG family protein [Shewanella sp. NIFS-20-20]|uniref:MAPEG family protein n=1 Tax=Shewanella sp. NIFS-20-20 TaxID=2853806 RepID=UPI001C478F0E|nr:MAPEG family protein [Shewanella sp. NIFS-20-20]MBV7316499.1 MAPEG family protein [Shewanella sp. NIFS-20-20]